MRTLLARGPFGLDSISNETFSPPWRPSKSPSVPLRWKKYSCPSSALINPKPRSETSFLMVPVGISISYLSNGGANSTGGPVREDRSLRVSAGASPATHSIPRTSGAYSRRLGPLPSSGLLDLREVALPQPKVLRGHLQKLVVGQEVERLLQAQACGRRQPHRDVGGRRAHVRLLLLPAHVDADVAGPLLEADDHPLVDLLARLDERDAPLLGGGQPVGQRGAGRRRGQGSVALLAKLPHPVPVADPDRAHDAFARGQGQECVSKADQTAGRDQVLEADPALVVVDDLDHLAAALAQRFGDRAEMRLADVNGQPLDGFHALAVDDLDNRLRPRDLQLIAFAAHGLDEDGQVQLA